MPAEVMGSEQGMVSLQDLALEQVLELAQGLVPLEEPEHLQELVSVRELRFAQVLLTETVASAFQYPDLF